MAKTQWIEGKKYDFNQKNVDNSPDEDGVYGLVRGQQETIVYIGQGNIRDRLKSHFRGDNPCITREKPTEYYREVCDDPEAREKELLDSYSTLCNKKAGG